MVTFSGIELVFVRVNEGRLPVPLAKNPVTLGEDATAVQLKLAPATLDVQLTAVDELPEQITSSSGVLVIRASGITKMRYCTVSPGQLLAVGVRMMVRVSMVFPVLVNVNAGTEPVAVGANPVRLPKAELAVQLIVVLATGVLGVTAADVPPEQICSNRGVTDTEG
jgi:hypothetical protein